MSSFSFSRKVAFRYLWTKRSEAFITIITIMSILGVAIGVMVINITMAVMTGFESELKAKIIGTNSHIVVRGLGGQIHGFRDVMKTIQSLNGVTSVSPFTQNQALLRNESRATGVLIRGIEPGSASAMALEKYLDGGETVENLFQPVPVNVTRMDENMDAKESVAYLPAIVIGRELQRTMGVFLGTPISLLSPTVSSSPFGLVPKFKRFALSGVYKSGLVEYEAGLAYMSLKDAQIFFDLDDSVSGLEVRVANFDEAPQYARRILDKLGGLSSGLFAESWTESNKALWDAIRLEKTAYFVVLLLIIVMASFSIISTLIMIVLEKRKDIAILRTMGATKSSIANIFRIQGAVIGVAGTVLGLMLGFLGCVALREYGFPLDEKIFQMSTLPVRMEPLNFALVGVSAFFICCVATVYPARRASSLQPSEVLRYE